MVTCILIKSGRNLIWRKLLITCDKLKGSFITHIDGGPVFSTKDAEKKLEQFYQ